jgi:hypothetical protein
MKTEKTGGSAGNERKFIARPVQTLFEGTESRAVAYLSGYPMTVPRVDAGGDGVSFLL